MTAELKPCPFCGGEAELQSSTSDPFGEDRVSWRVVCREMFGCQGGTCNVWEATPDDAVRKWNTRAERTCRNLHESPLDFECSECSFAVSTDPSGLPNWQTEFWQRCPSCGAKVVNNGD